jgi:MFS family permease
MVGSPSFGALRHRNFRFYFAGHLISMVGWWMHQVAQPWLVLVLTDSAFYVGLVAALGTVPITLLSLYGGVVADRFPKRFVVIATQTAFMVVTLALAAAVLTGVVRLGHVIVAAAALGVIAAFDLPGRQSLLVEMVGKPDLMNAIALNSSAFSASRVLGPAVGGLLIGAVGVGMCFLLNGLSYVAVVIALVMIRIPMPSSSLAAHATAGTIREGLRYVIGERRILTLLGMVATTSVFGFSFQVLMPVFVRESLARGAVAYGWTVSAAGVGALIGALGLATFARRVPKGRVLGSAAISFGVILVFLSFVRWFPAVLLLLVFAGLAMITYTATTNTLLQTIVPDDLRGRVMSVYTLAFIGLSPIGSLVAGGVADRFGPAVVFGVGGLVCATVPHVALRRVPELWKHR